MLRLKLDDWQEKFLATEGDKILCTGRQVGKSVICGNDAGEYVAHHRNKVVLMIAPTERQAYALFEKTLEYLLAHYPKLVHKGRDRPTKTKINLTNGSKIFCLPTGVSGIGIRFLTVHRLYVDEASRIPPPVWSAVTPMLLTTGGKTVLLSTPAGKVGFFYEVWSNKDNAYDSFTRFSATSEEVIKKRVICKTWTTFQRDAGLDQLKREESRMTKLQYAQEYLGMFIEELRQFFPSDLVRKAMTLQRTGVPPISGDRYLGVDVAQLGDDETVCSSFNKLSKDMLVQFDMHITEKTRLTSTVDLIKNLDSRYNYRKIYIDDSGLGAGVLDPLLVDNQCKRKVIGINNARKSIEFSSERTRSIMKEDLYNNLLKLLESGKIQLFDEPEILLSLTSVQYEYITSASGSVRVKLFGSYTHICESFVRAAWCMTDKSLKLWIR